MTLTLYLIVYLVHWRHYTMLVTHSFIHPYTHQFMKFHENCHSVTFYFMKKDSKRCCGDTTTPESIHTKDESKRGFAFAFIFGVN